MIEHGGAQQRFRTLRELIQTELTNLGEVPAVVVVVPEDRTVDVYSNLGSGADTSKEFIASLDWIVAERSGDGVWISRSADREMRQRLLENMEVDDE